MKVKVTRAFLLKGVRQDVDKVIELDDRLARELVACNKVERAPDDKPAGKRAGPMTTPASALVAGAKPKDES